MPSFCLHVFHLVLSFPHNTFKHVQVRCSGVSKVIGINFHCLRISSDGCDLSEVLPCLPPNRSWDKTQSMLYLNRTNGVKKDNKSNALERK